MPLTCCQRFHREIRQTFYESILGRVLVCALVLAVGVMLYYPVAILIAEPTNKLAIAYIALIGSLALFFVALMLFAALPAAEEPLWPLPSAAAPRRPSQQDPDSVPMRQNPVYPTVRVVP